MDQEKTTLEVIAPSVDEAVSQGLNQLNIPREAVKVEILDAGSKGIFGLGNRQARVRLTVIGFPQEEQAVVVQAPVEMPVEKKEKPAATAVLNDPDHDLDVSRTVVEDLLQRMKVFARVQTSYLQPSDEAVEEPTILVDIQGNDLSILIGRRSETLNALQYISSLIIGKELGRWVPVLVDVQGYRVRRERQIRQLARRMAEQAVNSGRRQVLEPMPANERRLVHMELRNHPKVTTESTGEEPNRKVTISVKK